MKRGALLAGLGCVLVCVAIVVVMRGRPAMPERDDTRREIPPEVAPRPDGTDRPLRETLEAEGSELRGQESPANNTRLETAGKPIQTSTAIDFLPYPNEGESAFKLKYGGMDLDALAGPMLRLRDRLNEEVDQVVQERYDKGLFDERLYRTPEAANADGGRSNPPQGMGKVWPCERATSEPDGSLKHWTTFLTEAEYPKLFAHQAEYLWVANTFQHMQKKSGKH